MRDKGKAGSLLCYVLSFFVVLLNTVQSKENKSAKDCLKIDFIKCYNYYDYGVYNKYYTDYFTVYITSRYYKMDSPTFFEVKIYDDDIKTIFYLFTDKKVYMSVNPEKESEKKAPMDILTENGKFINLGIKSIYEMWNVEKMRILRYRTKESKLGMIDTYFYITRDLPLPNSYFNFHILEDNVFSIKPVIKKGTIPGLIVWSFTKFYDKNGNIRFSAREDLLLIQYIKSEDSLFKIPKDYKKIEWNPALFKH